MLENLELLMGEEATDNNGDKVSVLAVWDGETIGHFNGGGR